MWKQAGLVKKPSVVFTIIVVKNQCRPANMTDIVQKIFFGRRKGKPMRELQSDLMITLLPHLSVDLTAMPPAINILEIGFGGGEHLVHAAKNAPDTLFLGAEAFVNGVGKCLAAIERENLTNIMLHFGTAEEVLAWLPPESLERIDLFYPDPWHKKRHWKRRFIQDDKLLDIARVLKPSGEFRFATDIDSYKEWGLDHISRSPDFSVKEIAPYSVWTPTKYEQKALREGRTPAYFTFVKNG
jgi:tRNA (guanine-N7-)-methyltransferase